MSTGADERLSYRDLAGQGARITRVLPADALPRLAAVAPGRDDVRVDMTFSRDADGRTWVKGVVSGRVVATCQRCAEGLERELRAEFDLCIVSDPELASALADRADVLLAGADDAVTVAEVVEDELLLALPERLCLEEPCPHAPVLSFPADEAPGAATEENPFHVLASLKRAAGESTD